MPFKPNFPGEFPTLGWHVLEWATDNLAQPDLVDYEPLVFTPEQAKFLLNWYRLDPVTGRRLYRRGVWSRPKGHGKSPVMGALAAVEGLADVVFDGWDGDGRPVGKPWREVRTPRIQLAAVSEDQTKNAYEPLLEMLREGPVMDNYRGIDPMETFVALPKGKIEFVTSAATSREGNRPIFAALDQTEEWKDSNGGKKLAATIRRNVGKVNGTTIETPNAFMPGEGSVAEATAAYQSQILEGRVREKGLLYDHREAPADTDMSDFDSLMKGLKYVYGDSAIEAGGWVDLERIVSEIWDPASDPQDSRRYYLNQVTHAADAWVTSPEWRAALAEDKVVAPEDAITLGFDGSRGRNKGKADATALVGCRVEDGHLFEIEVWEQPLGPKGKNWTPDPLEVDARLRTTFSRYNVVGFYADPSGWATQVAEWEAKYHRQLKVKASGAPIAAWPRSKDVRVIEFVKRFQESLVAGEMTHDGSSALTRHVLNARKRYTKQGWLIYKAYPDSPDKIDAAYAAVMAWKARTDAIAAGVSFRKRRSAKVVVM